MEHCDTKKHIKKMKLVGEDRGVPVHQTALEKFNDSNKLGTLMPEVKDYRCKALIAAGKANVAISEIIELGKSWVDNYSGYTLGNAVDIVTAFAKPVLNALIEWIRSILCGGGCFNDPFQNVRNYTDLMSRPVH